MRLLRPMRQSAWRFASIGNLEIRSFPRKRNSSSIDKVRLRRAFFFILDLRLRRHKRRKGRSFNADQLLDALVPIINERIAKRFFQRIEIRLERSPRLKAFLVDGLSYLF